MSTVGNPGAAVAAQAAAQAAAEAARRAAEEAARRAAAEAARQAAEAAARQAAAQARQAPAPQPTRPAAAAQTTRSNAESGMAKLVERHSGPKPMLDLSGGAAPRMPSAPSMPSGGGMSLSQLQSALKTNNVPVYDRQAAESFFGQFDYAPEGARGTQLVESIAVMALNGGKPDFGDDSALNCVQAAAVGQDYFNNLKPPVKTEIVVADEHAVLRMPDGSYYDPSLAMDDDPSTSPYLTKEEGKKYDDVPGVTVADREQIENGALASADAQPQGATAAQREQAAIQGATNTARGMGEVGALLFANKTEASVTKSEDGTSITVRAEVDLDAPFQPGFYVDVASDVRHSEEPGLVTMQTRTVTTETGFKVSVETPDKLPISVEGEVLSGSRDTFQVTMSEADWALVDSGEAPPPTIWDPSTIPVGGSVLVRSDDVQGTGLEVAMGKLAKLTLGSETTETSGFALSVERTGDTTVRVTSGPIEGVTQAMSVGVSVGDVSAGLRNEKTLDTANMQTAEFDLSVPEAKAAYDHLLKTGEYPPPGTPGVTMNGTVTSATTSDTLSAELDLFGWVEVSKTLRSSEANVQKTVYDDGSSQERYDFRIDDKKAVITRSYDKDGNERTDQQQASVLFTSLPGESSFHLFAAFEGGINAQQEPFMGGNEYVAEVKFTDAEAKEMQKRAQERVAQQTNEEGVNTSSQFVLALAEADTPEEVAAVMVQYGSDGQTAQELLDLMMYTGNGEPLPGSVTFKEKE